MLWHLVAAVFAGLAAAGVGLFLRVVTRKWLPSWIVPVCAGLGMLAYQINHEYSWFSHKQSQLPESAQIISSERGEAFWRPWTYFFPMTIAFRVVDQDNMVKSEANDQQLIEFILYHFEKLHMDRVTTQAYLLNCTTRDLVPLGGEQRQPRTTEMRQLKASAPLYQALCNT
ncbi:hypothetical protein LG290_13760 [Halomonas sediminis]